MRANMHPYRTRSAVRLPLAPPTLAAPEAAPTHATRQVDSTDRVSTKIRPRRCQHAQTLATHATLSTNGSLYRSYRLQILQITESCRLQILQIAPALRCARPTSVIDGR